MPLSKAYYKSPLGMIEVVGKNNAIISVTFVDKQDTASKSADVVDDAVCQIDEYFQGKRRDFQLKMNLSGTLFQNSVWNQLTEVAYGETASYQNIACAVGREKAMRAVGQANSQNPIAIVIPCHRIIGSNGKLTGYAGGLWRKEWLLNHEQNCNTGDGSNRERRNIEQT